jgi:hypothetical protein
MHIPDKPHQTVILIAGCCGKGYKEAKILIEELQKAGLHYTLLSAKPRQVTNILLKYNMGSNDLMGEPWIFVDDLLFMAKEVANIGYLVKLIGDLKKSYEKAELDKEDKKA